MAGLAILALGTAALFLTRQLVPMVVAISVMGLGYGLALPALNTLITSSVESAERGGVTALYGTVRFFGAALGPPAFGLLLPLGRAAMYLGSAAAVAAVLGLVAAFLRQDVLLQPLPARAGDGPAEARARDGALQPRAGRPPLGDGRPAVRPGGVGPGVMSRPAVSPARHGPDPASGAGAAAVSGRDGLATAAAPGGGGTGHAVPSGVPRRGTGRGGIPPIPLGPWSRVRSSFPPREGMSPAS